MREEEEEEEEEEGEETGGGGGGSRGGEHPTRATQDTESRVDSCWLESPAGARTDACTILDQLSSDNMGKDRVEQNLTVPTTTTTHPPPKHKLQLTRE